VKLLWQIVKWSILGVLCIACVAGAGTYYLAARLLRALPVSYGRESGSSIFIHRLRDIRYQSAKFQISANQAITGNLFFAFIELLLQHPLAGGIQVDTVTIGGNSVLDAINAPFHGKRENGKTNLKRAIWALKFPIFRFPKVQVRKVQIENFPISIENISLDGGFLGGELFHREHPDLRLEFNIKVKSLRKALQAWLNCDDSLRAFWAALNKFKGSIHAENIPTNVLTPYAPTEIRPLGTVTGTLAIKSGKAYGNIELLGVETRPIGGMGIMRDLQCRMNFEGDTVRVEGASAQFRQGDVMLTGTVTHKRWRDFQFNLHASGSNVPLLQRNGALLFGDADFGLVTESQERGGPMKTTLSGNVNFLPSQWYAETIKPKKGAITLPHGKITLPKDWDINVSLSGDRFLRIDMPYFHGLLSAQATIHGTIGTPVIHGQSVISQGVILFPFARFRITQGTITLDPTHFTPIWDVDSETRLYNYSLRLRLFGEGFTPTCMFNSSPTLPNGTIINMVTSGRLPGNKVGTFFDRNQAGILGIYLGSNLFGGDFADRIRIQMGQDICDGARDTIEIEFIINKGNSIIVERDRYGNCNVDAKIKIF
jgi:hypothetical protein